jgi:predicted DNA-binding transcriptional regulator AlpA
MVDKKALQLNEFCSTYGVARSSVYKWWTEGKGPKRQKIGRRVLIRVDDAEAWLANLAMGV